ncbi:MAG: hypothetical protein ACLTH3_10035 [Lachnospira sp.]
MFAAAGAIKSDKLLSSSFLNAADYKERLSAEMNDTSEETIEQIQSICRQLKKMPTLLKQTVQKPI